MIAEKEQFDNACGCGSYVGFNGDVEQGVSEYLDFDGDVESGEFDEFLGIGKKAKERRAVKKELIAQGVSRKDARQQAREKVGGKSLGDIISGVKEKIEGIQGAMDGAVGGSVEGDVSQRSTTTDSDGGTGGDVGSEAPAWQKYALWGGIGIAVLVGGFFAYRHFSKGKK